MTQDSEKWWYATAVQSGTNLPMSAKAATKEEVDTELFGRAYAANRSSVRYYRVDAPE